MNVGGTNMKTCYKAGILTILFTVTFLLLFSGLSDRWPTIFGLACVYFFAPQYFDRKDCSKKNKLIVLTLLVIVNVLLILAFCDKSIVVHQLSLYFCSCVVCFLVLIVKKKYMRERKVN